MSTELKLRERIETLEEENRQLKALLATPLPAVPPKAVCGAKISKQQLVLLAELVKAGGRVVPHERLQAVSAISPYARDVRETGGEYSNGHSVQLHRVRKALVEAKAPFGIGTAWGIGYYLDGDLDAAREALGVEA